MEGIVATPEVAGRSRRHTSVNFPCGRGTFCQHFVRPQDLPSTFCASTGSSVNFPCSRRTFNQLSVHPPDILFFRASERPLSFPCSHGTFREYPSTFRACTGPFVSSGASRGFSYKYCCYNGIFVHFQCATRPSCNFWCGGGNFHQFPACRRHIPSTSCAEAVL